MFETAKSWAHSIKRDVVALYMAGCDPRTPRLAKFVALVVAAYALSPIDLIPDFVPVLGYLDDIVIVPLGILVAVKLIPTDLMAKFRQAAIEHGRLPAHWLAAAIIVSIWVAGAAALLWWTYDLIF